MSDTGQSFFRSKIFLRNLLISIVVYVAIIWLTLRFISNYTLHGKTVVVPAVIGLTIDQAAGKINELELNYMIIDSVFAPEKKRGTIIDQNPLPGNQVKRSRKIYLTMNAFNPPKVTVPLLKDVSLRQAQSILVSYGLKVGRIEYVPDFAKDAVLRAKYKGRVVEKGFSVVHGESIDLVVGEGLSGEKIPLPNLLGLTLRECRKKLEEVQLNLGAAVFDNEDDSLSARVYRQLPSWMPDAEIAKGAPVDLFLTKDASLIELSKDSIDELLLKNSEPKNE